MDRAKAAISDFLHKSGHHDTTVHETIAPGIQHETVKPHHHEEINTAIDKEVHQDHYHRTVQPVVDREVLPEQHEARVGSVEHRNIDHRDAEATRRALVTDQAGFKSERKVLDTTHSQSAAPAVAGEHVHHHIHETIQPVIEKETIQPKVVHTTVPIHEVHHNAAKHHTTSQLPAVSMEEYKRKGGVLEGRQERLDGFEGEPKNFSNIGTGGIKSAKRDSAHMNVDPAQGYHGDFDPETGNFAGVHPSKHDASPANAGRRSEPGMGVNRKEGAVGSTMDPTNSNVSTQSKPRMTQKLNPLTDTDGDGKRGVME